MARTFNLVAQEQEQEQEGAVLLSHLGFLLVKLGPILAAG